RQALREAFVQRSYVLLVLGFFTCGFQIAFITVHMPAYLVDRGLSAQVGGWTIATIGLFNIIGSVTAGWLGDRMPKRYLLSFIYFIRPWRSWRSFHSRSRRSRVSSSAPRWA